MFKVYGILQLTCNGYITTFDEKFNTLYTESTWSLIACPYEIFNWTKCVKFLFLLVLLDLRKKTKKRFRKSIGNFLRYEFFKYLFCGHFVEIIIITMCFSQITKFSHN